MLEEIYIVYLESDYDGYDANTDTKEACGFTLRFFTNYDTAKKCADFCNLRESSGHYNEDGYKVATLRLGDSIPFNPLIEREKDRLEEERKEHKDRSKQYKLQKYAELIAEFEGGDKWEILSKLKEKHVV